MYPIDDYIIKQEKEGLSPWKLRLYNSHSIGADIAESIPLARSTVKYFGASVS